MLKTPSVAVETHGIDFVPLAERYGRPSRLFTLWFSVNLTILGVALGTLGVVAGLSFGWVVTALVLGNATGTIIMAAHSAQGPQLGVPQMIQSRAQFGVLGAALPLVAVVIMYTLYCAANAVLAQSPLQHIVPVGGNGALVLFGLMSLAAAFLGYEFIHRAAGVMAVISATFFLMAAYRLLTAHPLGAIGISNATLHFSRAAFILTATQAAAWGISYGPYVADYSRYLPVSVRASTTFWCTGLGCFLGSTLVMAFGAYIASIAPALGADPGSAIANIFGRWRPLAQLLVILGVLQGNVMNLYSAYMSTVTIYSGVKSMQRIGRPTKILAMAVIIIAATVISIWTQNDFQTYFADILSMMIYLLVPWSAINLADYYLVRHGHYVIADMFRADGQYKAIRWDTIGVYLLGIACQVPFMGLSFYSGPIDKWLAADFAWLPGLVIPTVVYVVRERSLLAEAAPAQSRG